MTTENKISLVHVDAGEVSEAAKGFMDHVANFIGGALRPIQIRRVAKAEADAALVKTMSGIHIKSLEQRAFARAEEEQIRHQQNIEDIAAGAAREIKGEPSQTIEPDWLEHFFQKARHVSNNDAQVIWSRILAGEYTTPGTFSKRTLDILQSMDKSDAEAFRQVCRFSYRGNLLIFDTQAAIYNEHGINYSAVVDLESTGLVQFSPFSLGFDVPDDQFPVSMPIQTKTLFLEATDKSEKSPKGTYRITIGSVGLTRLGRELFNIADKEEVPGFAEYAKAKFEGQNFEVRILQNS